MRRFVYFLLLVIFVSASASCVNASTDCERWFVAYRRELAHTRQVQRIAAAKRRAKLYAARKIAQVQPKPKPRLVPVVSRSPRMTRKETLNHFNLACGVLPEGGADAPLVSEETPAEFNSEQPFNEGVDVLPAGLGDLVAGNDLPPAPFDLRRFDRLPQGGAPVYSPGFGGAPGSGGGGGSAPGGGGSASGGSPGSGTTVPPAPPVVPEPSSYIFVLTGLAGAAGMIRRRFAA